MTTPLHCKVCAKPLHGQQRLYCGRPCKRRAYAAKQKLREAQKLAELVDAHQGRVGELKGLSADDKVLLSEHLDHLYVAKPTLLKEGDTITIVVPPNTTAADVAAHPDIAPYMAPTALTQPTSKQPSLLRRLYAYIQLLGHTLYHVFDGWRTK